MNAAETKQQIALDLTPKTPYHRIRLAVALVLFIVGTLDFVVNGIVRDVERTLTALVMDGILIFGGLSVAFTKTMLQIMKTILPFVKK
jgi:hypothetical protein